MILCHGCRKEITGPYIEALGHSWHKQHFVCTVCQEEFPDNKFQERGGKPYCERDFYELFGQKCIVCHEPLRGEYFRDSWDNSFCARHGDELQQCFTCRRLICESITGGGVEYEDGRKMCNVCRMTAVDKIEAALPLFAQVQSVLANHGLSLGETVRMPLRLASEDEIDNLAGGTPQIEAGLSLMETLTLNGLETGRNVKEIVILYGLPSTHAAAVLAHEFGHVWCFFNDLPHLPIHELEGICEMFSYIFLQAIDTPESRFHRKGIETNQDPVYGGGFRQIRDALNGRTLLAFLEDVSKRGKLC